MTSELPFPSRRTLLLAATAQALAMTSCSSMANPVPSDNELSLKSLLDQLLTEFKLASPSDLPVVFVEILKLKLRLSLSELGRESQEELLRAVVAIRDVLIKEEAGVERQNFEQAKQKLLINTILLQNTMISMGTLKDGTVSVTGKTFESAKKMLCLWPYC